MEEVKDEEEITNEKDVDESFAQNPGNYTHLCPSEV